MEIAADILIIEDDPSINEVVCAHLERRGCRCRQAFSGTEGLLLLRERRPDVVITDLMLPGATGEEIVRGIRTTDADLPIIVISARITAADKTMLLREGADDYLAKPFDLDELSARVDVQLRHRSRRKSTEGSENARAGRCFQAAFRAAPRERAALPRLGTRQRRAHVRRGRTHRTAHAHGIQHPRASHGTPAQGVH